MRQVARRAATAVLMAVAAACQPIGSGDGQIGMRVRFPAAGFQAKAIPATTATIRVTVSGEGMTSPLTSTLSRTQPNLLVTVPAGGKTISALAFDAAGKAVAQGSGTATVIAQTKVTAVVTLSPTPETSPTPEPSAEPSPPSPGDPATEPGTTQPTAAPTSPQPTTSPETPTATATPNNGGGALATPTPDPNLNAQITVTNGAGIPIGAQDM